MGHGLASAFEVELFDAQVFTRSAPTAERGAGRHSIFCRVPDGREVGRRRHPVCDARGQGPAQRRNNHHARADRLRRAVRGLGVGQADAIDGQVCIDQKGPGVTARVGANGADWQRHLAGDRARPIGVAGNCFVSENGLRQRIRDCVQVCGFSGPRRAVHPADDRWRDHRHQNRNHRQ